MIDGKTIAITRSKDDAEEFIELISKHNATPITCLLYTSPSPRDQRGSRMPSSA